MTILIVDDDERYRTVLSTLLDKNIGGHNLHTAKDGQEGVDMALRLKPSLIFLDIRMPGLSGIKAVEPESARQP